jgi:ElaB/YqjD/DUF883 family membrane-anchored ribosome-binding protein
MIPRLARHDTMSLTHRSLLMSETADIVTKEKLIADFKVVVADAEELLRATAGQAGDKMAEIRGRAQEHLVIAKAKLADAEAAVIERAKQAGRAADNYVHENPWSSVGIAAGVGFLIGLLVGRR